MAGLSMDRCKSLPYGEGGQLFQIKLKASNSMNILKIKSGAVWLSLIALIVLAASLAGCVTSKSYDKGAATSAALQASADAVAQTSTRITDVLGALNNLTYNPAGDLRSQFDAFTDATKKLNDSRVKLDQTVATMQVKATAYLQDWSNRLSTIQNGEIRSRSAARRDDVDHKLATVVTSYQGVKNNIAPFTSDVRDIQTYLGTDLTAGGLGSIKDVVAKTKVDAVPLRDSVKKLQTDFNDLSTALSPMLAAPDK